MFNYFYELMLTQYFTIDATFGRFIEDRKWLFGCLGKIYLLSDGETERLFNLCEQEEIKGIESEGDYFRYRRTKAFLEMNDVPAQTDAELDELIIIKGSAIVAAKKLGLVGDSAISMYSVCNCLKTVADSGVIVAMNVLGLLQQEGVIFRKDGAAGLQNIVKTAKWNSDQGLMMALYYDRMNRSEYLMRMTANLMRSSLTEELSLVEGAYGKATRRPSKTYHLLEKAFDQGVVKPDTYSKQYARILYSEVISHRDKESLFFSRSNEASAYASDLPLKLSADDFVQYEADASKLMSPYHKQEIDKLIDGLNNSDLRILPTYRPLCFVSDSRFALEYFAECIRKIILRGNVESVEVADLTEYDLEPTKNNVFVRNCNEDKMNVYLIFFRREINERIFEIGKNFLQTEKRSKFWLHNPSVCIDLSAIMPICFSDRAHANELRPYCEIVNIENFSEGEKEQLTHLILSAKGELYGIEEITMTPDAYGRLAGLPLEEIDRILDIVVCANRRNKKYLALTEEILLPYLRSSAQSRGNLFGFGGGVHE